MDDYLCLLPNNVLARWGNKKVQELQKNPLTQVFSLRSQHAASQATTMASLTFVLCGFSPDLLYACSVNLRTWNIAVRITVSRSLFHLQMYRFIRACGIFQPCSREVHPQDSCYQLQKRGQSHCQTAVWNSSKSQCLLASPGWQWFNGGFKHRKRHCWLWRCWASGKLHVLTEQWKTNIMYDTIAMFNSMKSLASTWYENAAGRLAW